MNKPMGRRYREIDDDSAQDLMAGNCADTPGLWFAAAVLCAFLAAGVIVYRTGSSSYDVVTAANEAVPAAAQAGPVDPAPILPIPLRSPIRSVRVN